MNIYTEFKELLSILCQVIIWTRFGLYTNMLTVSVALTFDGLISKSIRIIYTPKTNVCAKFHEHRSILYRVIMRTRFWSICQNNDVTVTLTFDGLSSKSKGIIYTPTCMSVPNLTNLDQFCV